MTSLREAILEAGHRDDLKKLAADEKKAELEARQDLENEVARGMALALTNVDGLYATRIKTCQK